MLNKYEDVLSDTLVKDRFLEKEANIVFNDVRVKPICVQTTCSPPRACEDNAKKALDELIKAGVIVEQNKPSVWCSPAHWVPKKDCGEEKTDADWLWILKD